MFYNSNIKETMTIRYNVWMKILSLQVLSCNCLRFVVHKGDKYVEIALCPDLAKNELFEKDRILYERSLERLVAIRFLGIRNLPNVRRDGGWRMGRGWGRAEPRTPKVFPP